MRRAAAWVAFVFWGVFFWGLLGVYDVELFLFLFHLAHFYDRFV